MKGEFIVAENKRDNIGPSRTAKTTTGDDVTVKKNVETIAKYNSVVQRLMDGIKSIPLSRNRQIEQKLDDFNEKINKVLDNETERYIPTDSGANGKDFALFLNTVLSKPNKYGPTIGESNLLNNKSFNELMNDQTAQAAIILSDRYKNINSVYEDLRMITEQLSELADVIDTMRDTITNSDNLISDISRLVSFGEDATDTTDKHDITLDNVYTMEKATNIKDKLKKIIIPETLKYGNYFVFTQPYTDLFAKFKALDDKRKAMGFGGSGKGFFRIGESWEPTNECTSELKEVYSEFGKELDAAVMAESMTVSGVAKNYSETSFINDMEAYFKENIEIINDDSIPLMEDAKISALASPDVRKAIEKAVAKKKKDKSWNPIKSAFGGGGSEYSEGVIDMNRSDLEKAEEKYKNEFKDINGVFIKLYDPRKVIPIYVMDFCLGHYVLYETTQNMTTAALNAVHTLSRTSVLFQSDRKKQFEQKIVSVIADRICASIDKPFLQKNSQFKELIANAISYNDFYKKSFRVQFVPYNYMTHFKVNEDPNTHMGVSVLKRSLYYAMLYLTLLNFKIIMITTRSMDTRMFLVKTAYENKDISGRVNKVIGEFKENQISYNDFGSVRGILSKVGKGHDVGIPVTPNGDRAFDIEVMQGQQYDLDTPLMDLLRKGMITNTGCPSAMMNAMDEIDFARQLPMLHAKFVTRMVSLQEETEDACTELYRKILSYGGYETDEDKLEMFNFKWARPKSINITNINDMINNADQLTEFMLKVMQGENSSDDPRLRDRYFRYIVTKILMPGVFDWTKIAEDLKEYKLDIHADLKEEGMGNQQEQQ